MAATIVLLLIGAALAAGCALAFRMGLPMLRRRRLQRMWADLAARHRELDRELDKVWRQRRGSS
jgi:hypothetical protein